MVKEKITVRDLLVLLAGLDPAATVGYYDSEEGVEYGRVSLVFIRDEDSHGSDA